MKTETLKKVRELLTSLGDYTGNVDERTGIDRCEVLLEVTNMVNARNEIKPCPFCGSTRLENIDDVEGSVYCIDCRARGPVPALLAKKVGRDERSRKDVGDLTNVSSWNVRVILSMLALFSLVACSGASDDSPPDALPLVAGDGAAEITDAAPSPCLPDCRCITGYSVVRTPSACGCRDERGQMACVRGVF